MPVAFFTRTQTGKLVSRLNSDVIGAQQAFTSTLSTVLSNLISLVLVLAAMLVLSWQLTLAALIMLPIFLIPAKIVGRKLAELTRQQMQLNGDMSASMTERFSVSGALLVKLFGRLTEEHDRFAERAGAVRDVSVKIAMNGRFFMTSLRAHNPEWGLRDLEAVSDVAAGAGFVLAETVEMPANNFSLVFKRREG